MAPASGSFDAHAADGMLDMTRSANGTGSSNGTKPVPKKIIVRIDWDAFMRGFPIDGEVCEIAGVGPVSVSAIKRIMRTEDPFLAAVVTKGKDVVTIAHLGRKFTAHQQTAMQWRDPICTVRGCNQVARLEMDHRDDWSKTKVTLVSCADRLCDHHHKLKTRVGWKLVTGCGTREMVPPEDQRQPDFHAPSRRG